MHKGEERVVGLLEETRSKWRQSLGGVVLGRAPGVMLAVVGAVGEWWTRERVNRKAEMCLPNRRLDVLVIVGAYYRAILHV